MIAAVLSFAAALPTWTLILGGCVIGALAAVAGGER